MQQDKPTPVASAIKQFAISLSRGGLCAYLLKAFATVMCLWVVSRISPLIPAIALLPVFIAYSLMSTLGALYFTTIKRIHREYELAKEGRLSQINRKWPLRMAVFFIISLVSAFLFTLESPRWDALEWILTFLAVPIYFVAFKAAERGLRKEFDKKFLKARAMKASFWLVGVILCLVYAILATAFSVNEASGLREAFEHTPRLFADSPSAIMGEADLISSFSQGLTSYMVTEIAGQFFIVGVIYHFAVYAFVFFGLINQFGFCLLSKREIKGEFQLLPANYESRDDQPILKRYIVILVSINLAASVLFLFAESKTQEAKSSGEPTKIEIFIEDRIKDILYRFDDAYEKDQEFNEVTTSYRQNVDDVLVQRGSELNPLIDEYFDRCKENVDAYLDWYESFEGQAMRSLKWLPGNIVIGRVKDHFLEDMNKDIDSAHLQEVYRKYQSELDQLQDDYADDMNEIDPDDPRSTFATSKADGDSVEDLDLWGCLSRDGSSSIVGDVLLNSSNLNREELKNSIFELIDQAKRDVYNSLEMG